MAEATEPQGRMVAIVGAAGVQTEIDLDTLGDEDIAEVIPELLADYSAECKDWTLFAGEHWKCKRWDRAEELLVKAIQQFAGGLGRPPDFLALVRLHSMLAHFHLARARSAPRAILPHAKYDKLKPQHLKDFHYTEAAANLNKADQAHQSSGGSADDEPSPLALGKIILHLARGNPTLAQPLVTRQLQKQPSNLIALLAQARLMFARRMHDKALEIYQRLLAVAPEMSPDPRIGLGLSLWMLGDKGRARLAWNRALKRDPGSWPSLLLLGLADFNTARDPLVPQSERLTSEASGVSFVQQAFKLNNQATASALALASIAGSSGRLEQASKLAERAIQYSDNKRHTVLSNAERGRLGFVAGDVADAGPFIAAAKSEDAGGVNFLAELTLGQIAIKNGNLREALNFIEQTAKRLNGAGPLEYTVLHACLLNYPHPGMTPDELCGNRATARRMLTELHKQVSSASSESDWAKLRGVGTDVDIFLDLAKMWQDESIDVAVGAYQTAVSVGVDHEGDKDGKVDMKAVKIGSNLGALYALQGNLEGAEARYQEALQKIAGESGGEAEMMRTVLAFNLGRAYEEEGEVVKASQWYKDVLRQHPEHMESKVRLAAIAASQGRNVDAHNLLKECLRSDEASLPLRSAYTHFLISIGSHKEALAFTSQTLKFERADVYTFCALGWIHYTVAREAKSSAELADRSKQYLRSAEAYERALVLDPKCAMAAQGLAIALAEDTLALKGTAPPVGSAEDLKLKMRLAGQALGVLGRINDSVPDGSTSVNMGHCYFVRGEEEKAIQAYEAAETRFKGRNVPNLLYLSRTWYASANRDSNYSAMGKALSYAQKALHIQPSDRAILYNIAMIQQKSVEMLLSLHPSKRTLEELQTAMLHAQQAGNTFRALASDTTSALPYDKELANQRASYGDGVLRKAPEQIARQEAYESEAAARVEEVRKVRAEEQAKIQAAEDVRRAQLEEQAAILAERRRVQQEEARAWAEEVAARQADEVAGKASRADKAADRKRRKEAGEDVDEDKPRRKRGTGSKKGRKGRGKSEVDSSDEESGRSRSGTAGAGAGAEEDGVDPEVRRRNRLEKIKADRKKKKREDPDEGGGRSKRAQDSNKFKSKAFIEDSDEEMGDDDDEDAREVSAPALTDEAGDGDDDGGDGEQEQERVQSPSRSATPATPATPAIPTEADVAQGSGADGGAGVLRQAEDGGMEVDE